MPADPCQFPLKPFLGSSGRVVEKELVTCEISVGCPAGKEGCLGVLAHSGKGGGGGRGGD